MHRMIIILFITYYLELCIVYKKIKECRDDVKTTKYLLLVEQFVNFNLRYTMPITLP